MCFCLYPGKNQALTRDLGIRQLGNVRHGFSFSSNHLVINECKYMKHIFELRMTDQIEETSS